MLNQILIEEQIACFFKGFYESSRYPLFAAIYRKI